MNAPGEPARRCRDCQHVRPDNGIVSLFGLLPSKWFLAECGRPNGIPHAPCFVERNIEMYTHCGTAARFFTPSGAPHGR
jgi:hypothetical protein